MERRDGEGEMHLSHVAALDVRLPSQKSAGGGGSAPVTGARVGIAYKRFASSVATAQLEASDVTPPLPVSAPNTTRSRLGASPFIGSLRVTEKFES